jgi:hypothetical protein
VNRPEFRGDSTAWIHATSMTSRLGKANRVTGQVQESLEPTSSADRKGSTYFFSGFSVIRRDSGSAIRPATGHFKPQRWHPGNVPDLLLFGQTPHDVRVDSWPPGTPLLLVG